MYSTIVQRSPQRLMRLAVVIMLLVSALAAAPPARAAGPIIYVHATATGGSTNIHAANRTICDMAHWNGTNYESLGIRRHEKHTLFYPLEDIIMP